MIRRAFLAALPGLLGFGLAPKQTPVIKHVVLAVIPEYGATYTFPHQPGQQWVVAERDAFTGKWILTTQYCS